jgi:hypothetical protein
VLQERAVRAISRQVALAGGRDSAKIRGDAASVELLLPQIAEAKAEREQALAEYLSHIAQLNTKTAAAPE